MIKTKETRQIKISQIIVDQDINPRSETRQEKVSEYLDRLSFSQAPAIKVAPMGDGRYLLIDGNHRLQAHKKNKSDEILADILDVDGKNTLQMDILALSFNLDHGLCVEPEMLRNKARYYCSKGLSVKKIMDIIRRPERTIRRWTKNLRKEKKGLAKYQRDRKGVRRIHDANTEDFNELIWYQFSLKRRYFR